MDKILKRLAVSVIMVLFVYFMTFAIADAGGTYQRQTISANDTFTDPIKIPAKANVNVSIRPITNPEMIITLQRQFLDPEEGSSTWRDVDYWTITSSSKPKEYITSQPEPESVNYRIGCKAGDYTSGSLSVRLGSLLVGF